tara:strand:+ start:1076 stop:1285 length:210 start_codon:yes stop_codon:yes gene_type:complete
MILYGKKERREREEGERGGGESREREEVERRSDGDAKFNDDSRGFTCRNTPTKNGDERGRTSHVILFFG